MGFKNTALVIVKSKVSEELGGLWVFLSFSFPQDQTEAGKIASSQNTPVSICCNCYHKRK